jgi:hypothetical protein
VTEPVSVTPRRGRRPGAPDTRAAILAAARELFAANGFSGTTIRAIAAAAGVDAALVHHYFGAKDDLFPLIGLARGLFDPGGQRLMREGFLPAVLEPIGVALGLERPEVRMPLLASQVLGLILVRYVLEVEPVASMPTDHVVAIYAPTLQRYLTGPLPTP